MNVIDVIHRWPNHETAMAHLEAVRWEGQPICPYCNSARVGIHASKDKALPRLQCRDCHRAFSSTVGTIFHNTHLSLQIWFLALAIILKAKHRPTNAQLARDLNVPYKTAWNLANKITNALKNDVEQANLFHRIIR